MNAKPVVVEETPEQAAESISAALDFLQGEAEAAGLSEVGELIREASARAKAHGVPAPSQPSAEHAIDLVDVCRAIVALPAECRQAFVSKKVYGLSYEEIASECGVPVDTAKARVMTGFRLVRASLRANSDR